MSETLIKDLSIGTITIIGLVFLAKHLFKHLISRDLEDFKNNLRIVAYEREIRFSRLHDKRAEIIAELYAKLVVTIQATASFVNLFTWEGEPNKEDKYKDAMKRQFDLFEFFNKHKIYFTEETCKIIDDLLDKLRRPADNFATYQFAPAEHKMHLPEMRKDWETAWKLVGQTDVPNARNALEIDFRQILGVSDEIDKQGIVKQ